MTAATHTSREQMDALADKHFRAEQNGDIGALVAGFAHHDVA